MNKTRFLALAGAGALFAIPAAAQAQDVLPGEGFIGIQAGVHDLGLDEDGEDLADINIEDSSPIVGVFAGYDLPIGAAAFAGAEVNYTHGFDAIDNEYGIAARLGLRLPGGAKFYARGGYQHVDLDVEEILGVDLPETIDEIDDDGDYLVGLGADFPLGGSLIRVNLDTIGFDTLRATAGVGFRF